MKILKIVVKISVLKSSIRIETEKGSSILTRMNVVMAWIKRNQMLDHLTKCRRFEFKITIF